MTYDEIVEWIDGHMPSHFTDYRDLGKFRKDYDNLSDNLPGSTSQINNFQTRMKDWLDGKFNSRTAYEDIQSDVEGNKVEDIKGMTYDNAKSELEEIKGEGIYTAETIAEVEKIVEEKSEVPITVEIEGEEYEIPAKFERGRPRDMVSNEVRATAGEILEEIIDAGASNDLDRLRAIEIRNLPSSLRNFLDRERRETISAIEEELREKEGI